MRLSKLSRYGRLGDLTDIAAGLGTDLNGAGQAALEAIAPSITISTTLTPPLTIDLTGGGGGSPSGLLMFLRPVVTLNSPAGPITIAPAGQSTGINPSVGTWAVLAGAMLAGLIGVGYYLGSQR